MAFSVATAFAGAIMTRKIPELVMGAGGATAFWAVLLTAIGDLGPPPTTDPTQVQAIAAK